MSPDPQVHDFADHRRRLPVSVEVSPVYELLLALFSYQVGIDDDQHAELLDRIDAEASTSVKDALARMAGCGAFWLTLIGVARTAPRPHTVNGFVAHLKTVDPVELRQQMLVNAGYTPSRGYEESNVAAASAGDQEALEALDMRDDDLHHLIEMEPEATQIWLVDLLCAIDNDVDLWLEDLMPTLERDAMATRALAKKMEPADLVEHVTNGVTFDPRPGLAGVILIPSVVIRPWVVISDHGNVRIFSYPVADQHLHADPATPPDQLVDVFKALGDDRRLRILHMLAAEPRTLSELTEKLDLAKSTTHHHLRTLRQAGLVRVVINQDDKRFELRTDAVPEAGGLLRSYLQLPDNNR